MEDVNVSNDVKSLWRWIGGSAFLASMCCFPSVVLVLFGLASVSVLQRSPTTCTGEPTACGGSTLLIRQRLLIGTGLVLYFRKDGICSLDEVKRQRKRIVNTSLWCYVEHITYIVFNFIILTEIGVALNLPWESSRLWN